MVNSWGFPFTVTCPKCKDVRSQAALGYRVLIGLLDGNQPIAAHCRLCGHVWTINDQDRARLEKDLAIFRAG